MTGQQVLPTIARLGARIVLLGAAAMTLMGCSGGDPSPTSKLMVGKDDLPGSGWVLVGSDDFTQFDLPEGALQVAEVCRPAFDQQMALVELSKSRIERSNRMYRSSTQNDSVQVVVYVQEFSDLEALDSYLIQAASVDQSDATRECFRAMNSNADQSAEIEATRTRIEAPEGGNGFAQQVVYTTKQGMFEQRFETYRWVTGDKIVMVSFTGPNAAVSKHLVEDVVDTVRAKQVS